MALRWGLVAIVAVGLAVIGAGVARADALGDQIASVKESVKKGETDKAIAAMKEVAKSDDARAVALLIGLTDEIGEQVACAAYELVAPKKDAGFLAILKKRAANKKLADTSTTRFLAVLNALAVYADKSTLPVFADVFDRYHGSKPDLAIVAAHAYAAIRSKPVVEQLIKWLLDCESTAAYASPVTYTAPPPSKETLAAYAKCHEALLKDLQAMTGQKFTEHKDWKAWWREAERSFKFPEPPAK